MAKKKRKKSLLSNQEWEVIESRMELTPRQLTVLRLIFDGKSDKQIANQLKIRPPTVRTHVQRIYKRVGVSGRIELVVEIIREFLTTKSSRG